MKFTIDTQLFLNILTNVSRAAAGSSSLVPLFQKIKLTISDEGLYLLASNGNFSIKSLIPNYIKDKQIIFDKENGEILVAAKLINAIMAKIPGEQFTFELIENGLANIESNNIVYHLNVIEAYEYPEVDLSQNGIHLNLTTKDISDAVSQVSFAASIKNSRMQLTAVNMESNGSTIVFTATDGARLAKKEIFSDTNGVFSVNIPSKTLSEIAKALENSLTVELYVSDKKVLFVSENVWISTTLIEGEYPSVKNTIPKSFNYYLEVNSEEFLNALSRVSLLSVERQNVVKLSMENGKVIVSSKSAQIGSAQEFLNLFRYTGNRLDISFNGEYVASAIRALGSNDVVISFLGEMKPFTVTDKNNPNLIQLITPVITY